MKERVNIRKEHAMTSRKVAVGALLFAMALLAAMGCWFCWRCPSRYLMPHDLFWRQVVANGLGLAVFAAAWLAGWRRLLKAAPWLMGIWLLAFVAAKLGRRVPEDLKIIGFDDTAISRLTTPQITTIHQPISEMAKLAFDMIIDAIEKREVQERNVLDVSLVARGTT